MGEMTHTLLKITETDIQRLSQAESFQRGESYYNQGALSELVRQGNELRGYYEGSNYEPYRVAITLSEQGISHTSCTCPYNWGGICKQDRKSTRLNSSHLGISYAVF